ncbi:MAG: aminomethyl-transferring glycine dehydrogenase subunit GcvPB [Anaerolineaceae bacterium]|nr:aminomethyl-transferring glycine dehydrogenase subunit GcvPB [Anaerolineaceae bacterium]
MTEKTIYELSSPGRVGVRFPDCDVPVSPLPKDLLRENLPFPELSEFDVVRHFTNISKLNYCIDQGFYPLGSCTMKYNPKINESMARLPGFSFTHPLQPVETIQGNLVIMYELQNLLKEISGFDAITLQPAAGAHGELVGIMLIRAYHVANGESHRSKILIPDSAHGTNPASSAMAGYSVVSIPSDDRGNIDLEALKAACTDDIAGLMFTNPNTLGLFDEHVLEVIDIVHQAGGLVYGDGANMNALLGIARPGDLGIDVMHFNLHKTFSTPHGGGGPGSGPVGVAEKLADFLPSPVVDVIDPGDSETPPLYGLVAPPRSIGRFKAFHGHFGMFIRAYTYISMHGSEGIRNIAENAVLNANYLKKKIEKTYRVPYDRICMHEFVAEGHFDDAPDIHALDIAKRMIDYGVHPPTNYFPLVVKEALMIEPTETESKQTLDAFIDIMQKIAAEAKNDPQLLHDAPTTAPMRRMDEVKAAKELVLKEKPL